MTRIDENRVTDIFRDCLYKKHELKDGKPILEPIIVEGIALTVGFNPESIERNKPHIEVMIDGLHKTFDYGWSFLNMTLDRAERQWTGSHKVMDELLILGLAIGRLEYCADRILWDVLPGGMPYIRRIENEK